MNIQARAEHNCVTIGASTQLEERPEESGVPSLAFDQDPFNACSVQLIFVYAYSPCQ